MSISRHIYIRRRAQLLRYTGLVMRAFIKPMFSAVGKFRIEEFARDWLKEHNPDRTEMINALQVSRCDVYVAYGFAALSSGGHAHAAM